MAETHATIPSVPSTNTSRSNLRLMVSAAAPKAVNHPAGLVEATQTVLSQKLSKHLKPKSIESIKGQTAALLKYFGDIPLSEVTAGSFVAYQEQRSKVACPDTVNHECALLKKILKKAVVERNGYRTSLWEPIDEYYAPMKPRAWQPPRVFTVPEQERIFSLAAGDGNLELANIVFTITRNTTASGCELRGMRLKHLELKADPPRVYVPEAKNEFRPRLIPLNEQAVAAFERAVLRCAKLGSRIDQTTIYFRSE